MQELNAQPTQGTVLQSHSIVEPQIAFQKQFGGKISATQVIISKDAQQLVMIPCLIQQQGVSRKRHLTVWILHSYLIHLILL